jgi:peptidoglycan/LPS O-acetylase OafA/YrhL
MYQKSAQKYWLDSWHVNPSSNVDFLFIDGLRGMAVLLVVVCCHLIYVNPQASFPIRFLGAFLNSGSCGVPIFFCISGFVIALPFWKAKVNSSESCVPRGYAKRRFWKIYPPLTCSILLFTPVYFYLSGGDIGYVKTALGWLSGCSFIMPSDGRLNPVTWSLVVEVQFYLTIPVLFLLTRRFSCKMTFFLIMVLFIIAPNIFRFLVYNGTGPQFHPMINSNFPTGMDEFAAGVTVAGLLVCGRLPPILSVFGYFGLLLIPIYMFFNARYCMYGGSILSGNLLRLLIILIAFFLILMVANPLTQGAMIFKFQLLRWFGLISYELYLIHQPIILWSRTLIGTCSGNILKYILYSIGTFSLSVLLAALIYRYISLPILKNARG